jgi:hypothetical protein
MKTVLAYAETNASHSIRNRCNPGYLRPVDGKVRTGWTPDSLGIQDVIRCRGGKGLGLD